MKFNINRLLAVIGVGFLSFSSLNTLAVGENAAWMKGSWGLNWKPVYYMNQHVDKDMSIEPFMAQIKDLKTIDYIQIHLNESYIFSAAHTAPHDVLESLWEGDTDSDGNPINLVVPRASTNKDQFQDWLKAIKAENLKTMVYVNSGQFLWDMPDSMPDVGERFKTWCDTDSTARWYLNRTDYRKDVNYPDRQYMFCYARFILQEYSQRYGDLIDAWIFDTASFMTRNGDVKGSTNIADQRIFEAFSIAAKSGNPNAVVSFNQGVGSRTAPSSPFAAPTLFDDYTFGHPFGGAGDMTYPEELYDYNYRVMTWMSDYGGYAFREDDESWNDNIISHFDPKMSTTAWNRGATPAFTNDEFVEWNGMGLINGGAISWGAPLKVPFMNRDESVINLTMHDYAVEQLTLMDEYLQMHQTSDSQGGSSNVAPKGSATQSSTDYSGVASRAIDGNTDGTWRGSSVTHTETEDGAWWAVELNAEYAVDEIIIYNRTDACCTERLSDFVVLMWDADGSRTLRKVVSTSPDPSVSIKLDGRAGKMIRINSKVDGAALNLAEVEVYGIAN